MSLAAETHETYLLPDELIEQVLTPALVIFPRNVRRNVRSMIEAVGGDANRWRPHLKTTKSPVIWHDLIDAGSRQFKCATTREASCMLTLLDERSVEGGDLLIAYPLLGPALQKAGRLADAHPNTRVSVLCEDAEHVGRIPESLEVFVDVNPQMNRTGVPMQHIDHILDISAAAHRADRFRGVHFYDGHIREDEPHSRQARAHGLYGQLLEIRAALLSAGCPVDELITSGTMTFEAALAFEPFAQLEGTMHRISPGTVVFHDVWSEQASLATDLRPAALIMTRVISRPADDIVTCDTGSKSIAAEVGDPCARVLDHPHLTPLKPSEEHLPIKVDLTRGATPRLGDVLLLVPKHICPSVNLAEQAVLIEDGEVAGIIDIAARGHELLAE